jgi:hypothetical protein
MQFPEPFDRTRQFVPAARRKGDFAQELNPGKLATFHLRILFRQNASWQGTIRWLEGKKEKSFRSVRELLFLIDSAIVARKAEPRSPEE